MNYILKANSHLDKKFCEKLKKDFPQIDTNKYLLLLEKKGFIKLYIENTRQKDNTTFSNGFENQKVYYIEILKDGFIYKQILKEESWNFIKKSILTPIAVSAITAIITSIIALLIKS